MSIKVASICPVSNHSLVKAVVELEVGGLRLRGLKLEQFQSHWRLSPPGRKILGRWQVLYDFVDGPMYRSMLDEVLVQGKFSRDLPCAPHDPSNRISLAQEWEESLYD